MEETFVAFRGIKYGCRKRLLCYKQDWIGGLRGGIRYAEGRHPALPALLEQRPRLDCDVCHGQDYYGRDDGRGAPRVMKVGDSQGVTYGCPCGQILCFYNRGEVSIPVDDQSIMCIGGSSPAVAKHQSPGVGGGRPQNPLPADASSTLFVEGLPLDCSRREVAHIFRIFLGYKDVRLVTEASRCSNGDPLVHCFVDFESAYYAATAMACLQGYIFDEQDPDSISLRLQFARSSAARSGAGHRGRS